MKGFVEIELKNTKTGEKKVVKGENMFTNALDSLINDTPFGLGNAKFNTPTINGTGDTNASPLNNIALGGVLLFPSFTKPNDPDDLYEPLSNFPTGYASRLNLSDDDDRLGLFVDSAAEEIEDEETGKKGYKFVYEWLEDKANGTIGAVALTSRKGGVRYFSDLNYMYNIYNDNSESAAKYPPGYRKLLLADTEDHILGIGNGGIFTIKPRNMGNVFFYKFKENNLSLCDDWSNLSVDTSNPDWSKTSDYIPVYCESENKLYFIYTSADTTANESTLKIITVDCNDWSESEEKVYTISNVIFESSEFNSSWSTWDTYAFTEHLRIATYVNGSFYVLGGKPWSCVYKIDKNNIENITTIDIPIYATDTTYTNTIDMHTDGHYVYIQYLTRSRYHGLPNKLYIISDDVGKVFTRKYYCYSMRVGRCGVYSLMADTSATYRPDRTDYTQMKKTITMTALSSYLATKYTLPEPLVKDNTQTMRITYTVWED